MAGIVHNVENIDLLAQVKEEAAEAAKQLAEAAKLHRGQIVVVGCSTSEVVGARRGQLVYPRGGQGHLRWSQQRLCPYGCLHRRPVL